MNNNLEMIDNRFIRRDGEKSSKRKENRQSDGFEYFFNPIDRLDIDRIHSLSPAEKDDEKFIRTG